MKAFRGAAKQFGDRMFQLVSLNVHRISLAPDLIQQSLCLFHIQLTHKPMLKLVVDDLIPLFQSIDRGVVDRELCICLAEAVIIDGHGTAPPDSLTKRRSASVACAVAFAD